MVSLWSDSKATHHSSAPPAEPCRPDRNRLTRPTCIAYAIGEAIVNFRVGHFHRDGGCGISTNELPKVAGPLHRRHFLEYTVRFGETSGGTRGCRVQRHPSVPESRAVGSF